MTPLSKTPLFLGVAMALMVGSANASEPVRICLAAGSEADGMTAMIHHADDSSVRVDSPYSDDPNSRITRWSEEGYFASFWTAIEPPLVDMDDMAPDSCDDGWRDILVVTFADGTAIRHEASCPRNPIHLLRNDLAMNLPSFVENASRVEVEGAADGVYAPCSQDW
ncbi:MAG: hypothetical protein RIC24_03495 [Hyphomicrobiales bacterium]